MPVTPDLPISTESPLPPAVLDMLALQAELCGAGVVLEGALIGDELVIFEDEDAKLRQRAGFN